MVLLIENIQRGEEAGMDELYRMFSKGVRWMIQRRLGAEERDDLMHDAFTIVVQAIQRGDLRDPHCLMGYVMTVVRLQIAAAIDRRVRGRREESDIDLGRNIPDRSKTPEESQASREQVDLMKTVLDELSNKHREILTRFYLKEETQEEICLQMHLTNTQFRLLKCRAKVRFGELGKKWLAHRALAVLVRQPICLN
jgi:RNA polymerase sigma-70 factor (ECF subfamily)